MRCGECGRSMSARRCQKPEREYFYYVCVAGAYHKRGECSTRKHHKADELEARVWGAVSRVLKKPERLRAGLDRMIEQERGGRELAGEAKRWLEQLSEVDRKRARYQEMAAEDLISFDEPRAQLSALEDTRKTAERELHA